MIAHAICEPLLACVLITLLLFRHAFPTGGEVSWRKFGRLPILCVRGRPGWPPLDGILAWTLGSQGFEFGE
jgi:hypothetical protein